MRRLVALAMCVLLTLQGAWAGVGEPLRCACGTDVPAPQAGSTSDRDAESGHCRTHETVPEPRDDTADDTGGALRCCGESACAQCHEPLPSALPPDVARVDADAQREAPRGFVPRSPADHVRAPPLRPPRATRG